MQGDTGSLQDLKRYHLEHHNVPKTIYEEGNPPGISENANGKVQGSLLSGIDNKTVRRLEISRFHPLFTFALFSVTLSL